MYCCSSTQDSFFCISPLVLFSPLLTYYSLLSYCLLLILLLLFVSVLFPLLVLHQISSCFAIIKSTFFLLTNARCPCAYCIPHHCLNSALSPCLQNGLCFVPSSQNLNSSPAKAHRSHLIFSLLA